MTIKFKELFGLTAISDEAIERAAELFQGILVLHRIL